MSGYTFYEESEIKTIILFIIDNYGENASNGSVTDIFMELEFVDYFTMQIYLNELVEAGLLEMHNSTCYILTDVGKEAIGGFSGKIPHSVRVKILETIREYKRKIENGKLVSAIYRRESDIDHIADLKILEGGSELMSVSLNFGSVDAAREACVKFKENPQAVYKEIIKLLS